LTVIYPMLRWMKNRFMISTLRLWIGGRTSLIQSINNNQPDQREPCQW
jgi:hypothetical protein